jgi:hypothetical protein
LVESQQQLVENNSNNNSSQQPLNSASTERRSPKRRRTDIQDDPSLVSPDTGTCPLLSLLYPVSLLLCLCLGSNRLTSLPRGMDSSSANSTPYRQPDV